jgi:hypothetical protein
VNAIRHSDHQVADRGFDASWRKFEIYRLAQSALRRGILPSKDALIASFVAWLLGNLSAMTNFM